MVEDVLTSGLPASQVAQLYGVSAATVRNGSAGFWPKDALRWPTAQLKHHYTRPYRPQTNGKAERFIQSALREWA